MPVAFSIVHRHSRATGFITIQSIEVKLILPSLTQNGQGKGNEVCEREEEEGIESCPSRETKRSSKL